MIDFIAYDKQNPDIWDSFVAIALETKNKGFDTYSANGIFEIIRWQTGVTGKGQFKVNNNFRPDYARKLEREYPMFKGFFRTRELKATRVKKVFAV